MICILGNQCSKVGGEVLLRAGTTRHQFNYPDRRMQSQVQGITHG